MFCMVLEIVNFVINNLSPRYEHVQSKDLYSKKKEN